MLTVAGETGARPFTSLNKMLTQADLDAVVVATPRDGMQQSSVKSCPFLLDSPLWQGYNVGVVAWINNSG